MIPHLAKAIACACVMLAAIPAHGQSTLDRIDDWSEAIGWEAVGLLRIGHEGSCTGALIRADIVLTAAHCVYDQRGRLHEPSEMEFLAAWRDGQAISRRSGTHVLAHPGYRPTLSPDGEAIFHDLALLRLDQPIATNTATPFGVGRRAREGLAVSVVSYGAGRNDSAAVERDCSIARDYDGVFAMTCSIVPGSSGSPVFEIRNGTAKIVSVISALGSDGTAYGMDVSAHIEEMLADFAAGAGVYPPLVVPGRRVFVNDDTRPAGNRIRLAPDQPRPTGNGALFLKP